MNVFRPFYLTTLAIVVSFSVKAQENDLFIQNYKQFRSFVDSFSTYSIYIVPPLSTNKHPFDESRNYFKGAYQFLRGKKINTKRSDFIIGVLIDSLEVDIPKDSHLQSTKNSDAYLVTTKYRMAFNILVYKTNGETLHFPLIPVREFSKEKRVVVFKDTKETLNYFNKVSSINEAIRSEGKNIQPNLEDFKVNFRKVLEEYKNHYLDRVDW